MCDCPLRAADGLVLVKYKQFFESPSLKFVSVTSPVWRRAAEIRASLGFGAMDALHLAAAVEFGCDLFLTNDVRLDTCTEVPIEVIS